MAAAPTIFQRVAGGDQKDGRQIIAGSSTLTEAMVRAAEALAFERSLAFATNGLRKKSFPTASAPKAALIAGYLRHR